MSVELTAYEEELFTQARNRHYDAFTEYFFRLPFSGTWYTPEDRVQVYAQVTDAWQKMGRPEETIELEWIQDDTVRMQEFRVVYGSYGRDPAFLLPHGYLLLPWAKTMLASKKMVYVIEGGTGSAKCLPPGTLIQMADGSRKPVEDVQKGESVLGLDEHYKLAAQTVTGLFQDQAKQLLRVVLRQGQVLRCTLNHPLRTVSGWKKAKDLCPGDYVAVPRILPSSTEGSLLPEEAILLGLLLGDGCLCRRYTPYFTNTNPRMRDLFTASVEVLFPSCTVKPCHARDRAFTLTATKAPGDTHNAFLDWTREIGIHGWKSRDKHVPDVVFRQKPRLLSLFLSALYGCDGYASVNSGYPLVSYSSVSRRLVEDIHSLLLRFGIVSRITQRTAAHYNNNIYYTLDIGETAHIKTFLQFIGIEGKDTGEVYAAVESPNPRASGSLDIVPRDEIREHVKQRARERGTPICHKLAGGIRPNENYRMRKNVTRWKLLEYAAWLDDGWLQDLASSDVYWTEVKSVELDGVSETYNLEVAPDSNFIANGVITHNTSSVAIIYLTACAVHPGFDALNAGPTTRQSGDMMEEITKWVTNTRYERFVKRPRSGELFGKRPHPFLTIDVNLGTYSTFMCQTVGGDIGNISGNSILGVGKDALSIDESGLVADIDETMLRLVTRYRGTRRNGMPRRHAPALMAMTNPHPNPSMDTLRERGEEGNDDPDSIFGFANPHSYDNVYITEEQKRVHRATMTVKEQERWLEGSRSGINEQGYIPEQLLERCHLEAIDVLIEEQRLKGGLVEESGDFGITQFELPAEAGREYIVLGDPGRSNLVKMRSNNVPVVLVLDVTDFPRSPAWMVALMITSGHGEYKPWIERMMRWMVTYRAIGVYDATGVAKVFNEFPTIARYPLVPISLDGHTLATARTMFLLFAGHQFYAWPYIKLLWHEARLYRITGPGRQHLPDDILAALFVGAYYMRGAFYASLADLLEWDPEALAPPAIPQSQPTRDRYGRRRSRHARRSATS